MKRGQIRVGARSQVRPIIHVCTMVSVCIILLLIRSGKAPTIFQLSLFSRDVDSDADIRSGSGRYFFNRTAIRQMKIADIRQCYHISRIGLNQVVDPDGRDVLGCKQRLPQAIIVGVEESGAYTLTFFLNNHPSLMFTFDEKVHFFDWTGRSVNGIDWYRNKMPYASPDQITVETSLSYFDSSTAPDGIRNDINPRPRFIVVISDPVKRALLDFHSAVAPGSSVTDEAWSSKPWLKKLKLYPFLDSQSFVREGSFSRSVVDDDGKVCAWNGIVNRGAYVTQLRRWIEYFGHKQILIVDGDKLEHDPVPILNDIEDFLGVPRYFGDDTVKYDKKVKTHCLRKPLHYCPAVKPRLSEELATDRDTEAILRDFYRRYDRQLYQMLSRNFTWFDESGIFGTRSLAEEAIPVPDDVDDEGDQSSDQLIDADEDDEDNDN